MFEGVLHVHCSVLCCHLLIVIATGLIRQSRRHYKEQKEEESTALGNSWNAGTGSLQKDTTKACFGQWLCSGCSRKCKIRAYDITKALFFAISNFWSEVLSKELLLELSLLSNIPLFRKAYKRGERVNRKQSWPFLIVYMSNRWYWDNSYYARSCLSITT